jgi:hypothetical protein
MWVSTVSLTKYQQKSNIICHVTYVSIYSVLDKYQQKSNIICHVTYVSKYLKDPKYNMEGLEQQCSVSVM